MKLSIVCVGSHGTGKTEQANRLEKATGLPLITEQARLVSRSWGMTPAKLPMHLRAEYQAAIAVAQMAKEEYHRFSGFVSDRSLIDVLAYWQAVAGELGMDPWDPWFVGCLDRCLPHYDAILYFPPMFPLVADGERHEGDAFQAKIDVLIRNILARYHLFPKVYTIQTEGIEKRHHEICNFIDDRMGVRLRRVRIPED